MNLLRRLRGFTLIELLVALAVLALLALMSWRGIDGMTRTLTLTQVHSDDVLTLQTGLAQWRADWEAVSDTPHLTALDWNGQTLRITRRSGTLASEGVRVVAWIRRDERGGLWMRWQSPPLLSLSDWNAAWQQAERWGQNPSDADRQHEVAVLPLSDWQLFYYRDNAWSNPLSSSGTATSTDGPQRIGSTTTQSTTSALPDGVRLILTLPPPSPLAGKLTLDWVNPTVGGYKS